MKRKPTPLELKVHQLFFEAAQRHREGNIPVAEALYRKILELDPNHFDALHMVGVIGNQTNQIEECLPYFEKARKLQPDHLGLLVNYGSTLRKAKRPEEAIKLLNEALAINADMQEALYNKGQCLMWVGRFDEAVECYKKCVLLKPSHVESRSSLANALLFTGDFEGAMENYERTLALDPKNVGTLVDIASAFRNKGWVASAVVLLEKALALEPMNAVARSTHSMLLLQLGRFQEGWKTYEGRFWFPEYNIARRVVPPMYWEGEDLKGKEIFVWHEQGIGDEILYSSMIPDLAKRAGGVILEATTRMLPIYQRSFPSLRIVQAPWAPSQSQSSRMPDFQSAIASLGRYLRPTSTSFPKSKGYLKADRDKTCYFRERYGSDLIVGVSWKSSAKFAGGKKSSDLIDWAPILSVPGIKLVSLQYGDTREEIAQVSAALGVEILQDEEVDQMKDIDTFFAQVDAMDFVITTSSTTAHVAGALGKPGRVLVPLGAGVHWYWFLDTNETLWYPSLQIVRQKIPGRWGEAIQSAANCLKRLSAHS